MRNRNLFNRITPPLSHNRKLIAEAAAVLVVAGLIAAVVFFSQKPSQEDTAEGIAYIQSLEETDVAQIESQIKERNREERRAALENGTADIWQQFEDSVILGDSRAVGFSYYQFLPENQVMAKNGATIENISDYMDQIAAVNPSSIFLCYGINDITSHWRTVDDYILDLYKNIQLLKETLGNVDIYVNSIIPVTSAAQQKTAKYGEIPDWNEVIQRYCEFDHVPYVNITETVAAHSDLYEGDGIHMQASFYEYWAIEMITEVGDYEAESE